MFLCKNVFNIFSINRNHAYWNQRRLFCGSLPVMFVLFDVLSCNLIEDRSLMLLGVQFIELIVFAQRYCFL